MNINKRKLIDDEPLDNKYAYKLMLSIFPKKNDCASNADFEEVIRELKEFGIRTNKQFRLLMKKHRRWILIIEKEPLDIIHQKIYRDWFCEEEYLDCIRRQYWFCFPAMIRNVLEKVFGEDYENYASERDKT
jgi:hypothetical protein